MDEEIDKLLDPGKTLFSQRYETPLKLLEEVNKWEARMAPPREPPPPPYNGKGIHFVPNPTRDGTTFIHMAKEISRMYELDMDLTQNGYSIQAEFFLEAYFPYPPSVSLTLGALLREGHSFKLGCGEETPDVVDFTVLYYTHEICEDGEWLDPY